ncbi:MAG: hypothetical protein Q8878_05150 [Bacillota bacterium]|nr:hypothetical protein [Bacillota bacterium]
MLINNKLYNFYFINELRKKTDEDVILFGIDGMSYYGRLTDVDCNDSAILRPALLSSTNLVEIQNPAEVAAVENTVKVDLSNIIGFGYNITADPFVLPDENEEDVTTEGNTAPAPDNETENVFSGNECGEKKYRLISYFTLGGFVFAGKILDVRQNAVRLTGEYIFAPGGDGSTLFSINRIVVNLKASTAVGS